MPPSNGPWQNRVRWGAGTAYRPDQVLVPGVERDAAIAALALAGLWADEERVVGGGRAIVLQVFDAEPAVGALRAAGIRGQLNHVFFATCLPVLCGCGWSASPYAASPYAASPYAASPYAASPYAASPYAASPYAASPYAASGLFGSGCGCPAPAGGTHASPYAASPYAASSLATPTGEAARTGERRSSAKPAPVDADYPDQPAAPSPYRVGVLDTGWRAPERGGAEVPPVWIDLMMGQGPVQATPGTDPPVPAPGDPQPPYSKRDVFDATGDRLLDPAAGHGTFIGGIVGKRAPGAIVEVHRVIGSHGDAEEADIVDVLASMADQNHEADGDPTGMAPAVLNLSFGTYAPDTPYALARVIDELLTQGTIVVAAAGNDGTCWPMVPAALPGVVGVGALDATGQGAPRPAPFTNVGPWVRACASGVDLVSLFFDQNGDDPAPPNGGPDPDDFTSWATWSGTSFATAVVAAAMIEAVADVGRPQNRAEALEIEYAVVPQDDPTRRYPWLGVRVD